MNYASQQPHPYLIYSCIESGLAQYNQQNVTEVTSHTRWQESFAVSTLVSWITWSGGSLTSCEQSNSPRNGLTMRKLKTATWKGCVWREISSQPQDPSHLSLGTGHLRYAAPVRLQMTLPPADIWLHDRVSPCELKQPSEPWKIMTKCLNSLSLGALYYPEINNWNISPGSHGKATLSANTRTISMDGNKWETVSPVTTPLQSSCLENPMDGGPGGLQSMGSRRVGHDWATSLSLFTFMHWRRK